jgi:hypothetical protein
MAVAWSAAAAERGSKIFWQQLGERIGFFI